MRNKLIFGSTAAKHFFSDFREPKDLDYLINGASSIRGKESYYYGPSTDYILQNNKDDKFVDPEFLYVCKFAHCKWDIFWDKTMADIKFFQDKGVSLNKEVVGLLRKDFKNFHRTRWAKLKDKNSKTFFEDAVQRKYVHDSVHLAIAHYDAPLYESILKNPNTVECSEEKFNALEYEEQLKLVKEEIWVTALERFMIPDPNFSRHRAYYLSLKKLIISMSGAGWFNDFVINNFYTLLGDKQNYVQKMQDNKQKLIEIK